MDRRGHRYLDPGNPRSAISRGKRAHEEELSEQILEQLDYIKGVRVEVRVITAPAAEPAAPRAADKPPRSQTDGFKPAISINGPPGAGARAPAVAIGPSSGPVVAVASKHEQGRF